MMNLGNMRTLSELIDKYLIPQELGKKTNAEVSTPFQLRQDMLDNRLSSGLSPEKYLSLVVVREGS